SDQAASLTASDWEKWISTSTPTRVVDCPVCGGTWGAYIWQWTPKDPEAITCRLCSTRITQENYPDNDSLTVQDPQGHNHRLPVHRAANGKIYQFRQRVAYEKLVHIRHWLDALAALYALKENEKHAAAVHAILSRLADVYPGYALHDWDRYGTQPWPRAGKISGWNYEDAVLIVSCGKAYDATRNSAVWNDADRDQVMQGLFRTAADFLTAIAPENQVINDTPFRYAGVAMCGRLLNDPQVMRWVLNPESGIVPFLLRYFYYDGSWCERSPSYHTMALREFHQVVAVLYRYSDPQSYRETKRFDHFRLQDYSRLQRIYENLFALTYPDGTLPPINDSHAREMPNPLFAEAAFAWFRSPQALMHLADRYGDAKLNRGDLFSLFYRPPQAPAILENLYSVGHQIERPSLNSKDLGLAILRSSNRSPETMVTVQYGDVYGGHDHMDKLDLTLFARGRQMLSDLGYIYYMHPLRSRWMLRSLAHNTVTVNTRNQRPAGGDWQIFHNSPDLQVVEVNSEAVYAPITEIFNRQLLYIERPEGDYLVDIFRVRGGKTHDWSAHAETPDLRIPAAVWQTAALPGRDIAYEQLQNIKFLEGSPTLTADWIWEETPGAALRLHLVSPKSASVFRADAPAQRTIDQVDRTLPYLVVRNENQSASTFVAIWEPTSGANHLQAVVLEHLDDTDAAWPVQVHVTWTDGAEDWIACALQDKPPVISSIAGHDTPWHGRMGLVRLHNGRIEEDIWLNSISN
ncbi:heparinase II/III family protein, partial [candidate division KSB1 bacterium]|nr:heparinase II/III family protein [candidate division KSB1 bacterium]